MQADGGGKFICNKLRFFYKKLDIVIKYVTLYVYKENKLAKRGWKTIVTKKDLMLIDSDLPSNF